MSENNISVFQYVSMSICQYVSKSIYQNETFSIGIKMKVVQNVHQDVSNMLQVNSETDSQIKVV